MEMETPTQGVIERLSPWERGLGPWERGLGSWGRGSAPAGECAESRAQVANRLLPDERGLVGSPALVRASKPIRHGSELGPRPGPHGVDLRRNLGIGPPRGVGLVLEPRRQGHHHRC